MMYRLTLNKSWALNRMIGLYLPGYKVWGHAFSTLWCFVIIFSGHTRRLNNAARSSFPQIWLQPISSSQLEPALPPLIAKEMTHVFVFGNYSLISKFVFLIAYEFSHLEHAAVHLSIRSVKVEQMFHMQMPLTANQTQTTLCVGFPSVKYVW